MSAEHSIHWANTIKIIVSGTAIFGSIVQTLMPVFLYRPLKRTFDPILFNERYWTPAELQFYSGFPYFFVRIGAYAVAVGAPRGWFDRRFKGFDFRGKVSPPVLFGCRMFVILGALIVAALIGCAFL